MERRLFLYQIYARTFGAGDGPLVLQDLSRQFWGDRTTAVAGDPYTSAFYEGQRSVVLHIRKRMKLSEEEMRALESGESNSNGLDPFAFGEEEEHA